VLSVNWDFQRWIHYASLHSMSGVAIKFLDQGLHRVIFDAMPMPVFVVDEDVCILEYNSAAAKLLNGNREAVLRSRGGEVLHCVHSTEDPRGCGFSVVCPDCVVRKAVRSAAKGGDVVREWADLELKAEGGCKHVKVRVSSKPFTYEQHSFILLILEGLNDASGGTEFQTRARPKTT